MKSAAAGLATALAVVFAAPVARVLEQSSADTPDPPCASQDDAVIEIRTDAHRMALCRRGLADKTFRVRLASNGVGKEKEGDSKVPVGLYPLGPPRSSKRFWAFIPIGYPTAEQRRQGFSGGNVGIHGPDRSLLWLGSLLRWFDTTHGCIGLAYDEEMDEIVAWLDETKAETVRIE
jgi:hypothetical protein